ncbi:hypothetical protein NL676_019642 [Syzygium grande]|nr:hypothetical protein NL676_019642 [Syzygium grande]
MALALLFLVLVSMFATSASQKQMSVSRGSALMPKTNSSWLSASGFYAFGFYQRGNGYSLGVFLAGIPLQTVVWTFKRDSPPFPSNATLQFTTDGRLILQSWLPGQFTDVAVPAESAISASMLDSGNFVLYDSNGGIIWQTFDSPTDSLLPGQNLSAGHQLVSSASESDQSSGVFRIKVQHDGNLVQYPVNSIDAPDYAYWSTETGGIGDNITLHMDGDGFLYLLNPAGQYVSNVTRKGLPSNNMMYLARIDADGIFRLYSYDTIMKANWSIVWNSTDDLCSPKGICGLNMYCVTIDPKVNCVCLPGFAPVQEGNWMSGCERNFTQESCKRTGENADYTIQPIANTVWEDDSYSVQQLPTIEECRATCLPDCNCAVVIYNNGVCKKQGLPLRFGRRDRANSNTVSIKLSTATSDANAPKRIKKQIRIDILVVSVSLIALALIILVSLGVLVYWNRLSGHQMYLEHGVSTGSIEDVGPRLFTYEELKEVTKDFKDEIGKGAFGTVYKGALLNRRKVVAVKRLENISSDGDIEFQTEVKIIGRTHHRSLVCLLGYCQDGPNRLLVYEYMTNGSLADLLFTPERELHWDEKMGIAHDIARGLLYLHEECETQIIHCDIKPHNILIDKKGRAKISDFGLSKMLKPDQTKTMTRIRGTRGYVAPEWHKKQPVTVKADIYSFGIVLLEIICSRRSLDFCRSEDEAVLEEWVYGCFQAGELAKLVDFEEVETKQLERVVKIGLWCVLEEPSFRPSMRKVLLMLEGTVDIPVPPSPTSFLSST